MIERWQQPARPTSLDWWFRDGNGDLVLAQRPNRPAIGWTAATAVSGMPFLPRPVRAAGLVAGDAARLVWSWQEARSGVTPARALMGAATLAAQLGALTRIRRRLSTL